jgi:hypothetical protein
MVGGEISRTQEREPGHRKQKTWFVMIGGEVLR